MAFYLLGLGLLQSQMVAAALTPFPNDAGTASALIGFVQQCAGAIVGGITVGALVGTQRLADVDLRRDDRRRRAGAVDSDARRSDRKKPLIHRRLKN